MNVGFRSINSETDWDWFTLRNPVQLIPDMTSILAYDKDTGALLAGCVMDNWTETSCQAHLCIDVPLVVRHGFLNEIADFVYNTAGRLMIHSLVPANNLKALSVDKKIGFKEVTRLKDAFKQGVDYVLLELRKEDCKYYKGGS